jgi:hypothetical protein
MWKYHCTIKLLFDWFGISCTTTDNFCFYLPNRLIQTRQTGGQRYSDTSPFSIPWLLLNLDKVSEHGIDAFPVFDEEFFDGDEGEVVVVLLQHVADGQEEILRLPRYICQI